MTGGLPLPPADGAPFVLAPDYPTYLVDGARVALADAVTAGGQLVEQRLALVMLALRDNAPDTPPEPFGIALALSRRQVAQLHASLAAYLLDTAPPLSDPPDQAGG